MSIKIQPVHHKSLAVREAGKLAASMLDGSLAASGGISIPQVLRQELPAPDGR